MSGCAPHNALITTLNLEITTMTTKLASLLRPITLGLAAIAAFALTGAAQAQVRVGSKNFTEQFVLGELYAQAFEAAGIKVEKKLNLGGTLIAHKALEEKQIDFYPCLLYTSPSPRDRQKSRMPSSA